MPPVPSALARHKVAAGGASKKERLGGGTEASSPSDLAPNKKKPSATVGGSKVGPVRGPLGPQVTESGARAIPPLPPPVTQGSASTSDAASDNKADAASDSDAASESDADSESASDADSASDNAVAPGAASTKASVDPVINILLPSPAGIAALADVTMRPPGYVAGEHSAPIPLPAPVDGADFEVSLDSEMPPAMSLGPSAPPSVARFGRYHMLGRLAMGGMAEIFLAREETAGGGARNVVIKLAREQLVDLTGFEEMFTNEGRLSMRLTHPNICHVYEFGKERGRYFMALEWVDGVSMRDLTRRAKSRGGALPVNVVAKVVAQVAEALDSAHRTRDGRGRPLNIVHRDVSPHNVMVSYDGVVKLLDFGVAKGRTTKEETDSGTVKGKFNYMSPQQCTGRAVDGRADVFSLGVCLWEALVAKSLFKRETQYETFKAIIEDDVPLVSGIRDDVPPELDEIIQKAVAKTLADRYQTAAEFHDALSRFLQKRGDVVSSATIASYMETLFEEEIASGPELDTSEDVVARIALAGAGGRGDSSLASIGPRKPNLAVALVAAAVLVLVGILAVSAWFSDPEGHDSVRRSATMSSGDPGSAAVEQPQEPAEPEVTPPVEVEGAGAEAAAGADHGAETDGTEDPGETGAEEADARSRAARAGRRGTEMRSSRMRRSMGSGFVADPGF